MSEQGGIFMQMIGGVASEKCSSCQLVDLKTNEFGLVNTDGSLLFPNQTSRREAPFPSGLGWKTPFHRRPVAFGEMIIFTTTSLGRTKILQFLPLRPPLGRTTKTCFCVGSDGYIRVERIPLHSWRLRLWWLNTYQVAGEGKVCLTHPAKAPSPVKSLLLFECCAVLVIFCFLLLRLETSTGGFESPLSGESICTGVPVQLEELCFTWLNYWLFVLQIIFKMISRTPKWMLIYLNSHVLYVQRYHNKACEATWKLARIENLCDCTELLHFIAHYLFMKYAT